MRGLWIAVLASLVPQRFCAIQSCQTLPQDAASPPDWMTIRRHSNPLARWIVARYTDGRELSGARAMLEPVSQRRVREERRAPLASSTLVISSVAVVV